MSRPLLRTIADLKLLWDKQPKLVWFGAICESFTKNPNGNLHRSFDWICRLMCWTEAQQEGFQPKPQLKWTHHPFVLWCLPVFIFLQTEFFPQRNLEPTLGPSALTSCYSVLAPRHAALTSSCFGCRYSTEQRNVLLQEVRQKLVLLCFYYYFFPLS